MSLLRLHPEVVRLRRLARACAAGEVSDEEYRLARRQVIRDFSALESGADSVASDDDTQTRDATQRRMVTNELSQTTLEVIDMPDASKAAGSRSTLIWLLLVSFLMLAAAITQADDYLPGVAERDPNPETSPRISVESLRLESDTGLEAELSTRIRSFLDEQLSAARSEQQALRHGFTQAELSEVARYLSGIGIHEDNRELSRDDLAALQSLVAEQKTRRGISIVRLEQIAAELEGLVRSSGLPLAVAYLPSQSIRDGVVTIAVLPGVLADVRVEGSSAAREVVERAFRDELGEVVSDDVGNRLFQLSGLAGLRAQGSFAPGDVVGESVLTVRVLDEGPWRGRVVLDNNGDESLGEQRLAVAGSWLSPSGRGDRLDVAFMHWLNPSDAYSASAAYQLPVGNIDDVLRLSVGRSDFTTSLASNRVNGDVLSLEARLARTLERSRRRSSEVSLALGRHDLSLVGLIDQQATYLKARVDDDRVFDGSQWVLKLDASALVGSIDGELPGQDSSLWLTDAGAFAWRPMPRLGNGVKFSVRARAQWADNQLPESLRLGLGGAAAVRGFDYSISAADRGLMANVALHKRVAGQELRIFADSAYGEALDLGSAADIFVSSMGFGWRSTLLDNLRTDLTVSRPISSKLPLGGSDDSVRVFWRLSYEH
ncbi:MAG: hypothetical protein NXH85_06865 [Pseudomonadaceae bacterium]|nr:hypothetical protein [Pseudomonadaceae bacterium]